LSISHLETQRFTYVIEAFSIITHHPIVETHNIRQGEVFGRLLLFDSFCLV